MKTLEHIEKYLEGKLSGDELNSFEKQLNSDPELSKQVEDFKLANQAINQSNRLALKNQLQQIHNEVIVNPKQKTAKYLFFGGAAIMLLIAGLLFFLPEKTDPTITKNNTQNPTIIEEVVPVEQSSKEVKTEKQTKLLADNKSNTIENDIKTSNKPQFKSPKNKESNTNEQNTLVNNVDEGETKNLEETPEPKSLASTPKADFAAPITSGCLPLEISFENQSSASNGQIVKYEWNFGDGQTSNKKDPKHTYKKAGVYSVSLTVWTNDGSQSKESKENLITAHVTPIASFKTEKNQYLLDYANIEFENTSQNLTSKTKFFWDFGDHIGTSKEVNPRYEYIETGFFNVTLRLRNEFKCESEFNKEIIIHEALKFFAPSAFSPSAIIDDNKKFKVSAVGSTEFHMIIVSRTGQIMYETDQYDTHGWDGTGAYGEAPLGTYVYKVKVKGLDGNYYDFKGSFSLLR